MNIKTALSFVAHYCVVIKLTVHKPRRSMSNSNSVFSIKYPHLYCKSGCEQVLTFFLIPVRSSVGASVWSLAGRLKDLSKNHFSIGLQLLYTTVYNCYAEKSGLVHSVYLAVFILPSILTDVPDLATEKHP